MFLALILQALAFDHSYTAYQTVLSSVVAAGKVDYARLKANPAPLDAVLQEMASANLQTFSAAQQKAFYINAYNALTLDLIADNYPLNSIMDLDGGKVWDTRHFQVAGQSLSLNQIENDKLRSLKDARIHVAINCAARSCPPLSNHPYLPESLDAQLDSAARLWTATLVPQGNSLSLSSLFDWFGDDFIQAYGSQTFDIPGIDGKAEAALNFIATYQPSLAPRLHQGGLSLSYAPYDWSLNRQ